MAKVLIIFTGGTISMKIDPQLGAVPALSGEDLIRLAPKLAELADLEVIDYARQPGPHWTPDTMWELSELVEKHAQRPELSAIVITHGTDTIEETAYFVDLRHVWPMPVVFVGAMRNSSEPGWDGPSNLYAAVRVAADPGSVGKGVLLAMNDTVHAASEVTKADTQALDSFQSPVFGPLGVVEPDQIIWKRHVIARRTIRGDKFASPVDLFVCYAGMDGRWMSCAVDQGAKGLVLEAMGRGNAPPAILPALQQAFERRIPVVIASRCFQGRVYPAYGYEGGGADLCRRGAILAEALPGHKARLKLMLALGAGAPFQDS